MGSSESVGKRQRQSCFSMGGRRSGTRGSPWAALRRPMAPGRGGSRVAGALYLTRVAARRFQRWSNSPENETEAASCGAVWREGEAPARRGVGSGRSQGGRVALQSAVQAAGGRENPRRRWPAKVR